MTVAAEDAVNLVAADAAAEVPAENQAYQHLKATNASVIRYVKVDNPPIQRIIDWTYQQYVPYRSFQQTLKQDLTGR